MAYDADQRGIEINLTDEAEQAIFDGIQSESCPVRSRMSVAFLKCNFVKPNLLVIWTFATVDGSTGMQ